MQFEIPNNNHQKVVKSLLEGKFILLDKDRSIFETIKENEEFYKSFFQLTFDYELVIRNKFCYLISEKSDEKLSKMLLFL